MSKYLAHLGLPLVLALGGLVSCSSSSSSSGNANGASIAPPAIGVQLASTTVTLQKSEEKYICWSFATTSAFSVVGTETAMPAIGVHHYAVFTSSSPVPAQASGYDCQVMDGSWGLVSGGGQGTPGFKFPEGVGMPLPAGQHIVYQLHMLNTSTAEETVPVAAVNLVGSTDATLKTAGVVVAGNIAFSIPPHAKQTITGGCPAAEALENVFAVFPHMHTMGTHIAMTTTPMGASTPNKIIDQSWDFGNQGVYPATAKIAKGDQIGVSCDFTNATDQTVRFGESTKDEMCLGVLYYYPATVPSQYCGFSK